MPARAPAISLLFRLHVAVHMVDNSGLLWGRALLPWASHLIGGIASSREAAVYHLLRQGGGAACSCADRPGMFRSAYMVRWK